MMTTFIMKRLKKNGKRKAGICKIFVKFAYN